MPGSEDQPHVARSAFSVRSYEVDSYGHLNNGVYANWFEQGRLDHLLSLGFSYDGLARRRQWIVVARTEIDFRSALLGGEAIEIATEVVSVGRTSCRYRQVMRRTSGSAVGEVACEALTVMVFTDERGPIPVPDDFRRALATGRPQP